MSTTYFNDLKSYKQLVGSYAVFLSLAVLLKYYSAMDKLYL